jgi:hypothetical protein
MPTDNYIPPEAQSYLTVKYAKDSKRQLIKEMARDLYLHPDCPNLAGCVGSAKYFYDNIEAELDRALGGEE